MTIWLPERSLTSSSPWTVGSVSQEEEPAQRTTTEAPAGVSQNDSDAGSTVEESAESEIEMTECEEECELPW